MRVQVFIDESGSIHPNSRANFFAIGGFFADESSVKNIRKRYRSIILKQMQNRNFVGEFKASRMKVDEKLAIFEEMQTFNDYLGLAVIFHKDNYASLKINQELFFNYAIFLLVSNCLIPFIDRLHLMDTLQGFDLHIDNRNLALANSKSLVSLLNTVYLFEQYDFKVYYHDSSNSINIQFADLITNTVYLKYANLRKIKTVLNMMDQRYIIHLR